MQCRKENSEEAFVRAITALPAGSKIGISKGVVVALGALMQAMGTDGKRHTMKDDGYLTWIQILTLILFIFVLGMAAGSFITVRAYRWANQFAQVTAPLVTATTAPTTRTTTRTTTKTETRTMMTQSQTTYIWTHATPRFNLANGKDGAWAQPA